MKSLKKQQKCTINDNGNERQLKIISVRNDEQSSVISEIAIPVISSERSDERSAVVVSRCHPSVFPEIRSRESRSSIFNKRGLRVKLMTKRAAFTLVELVITIAIVIILSVISVPIYQGYTKKAKMAEGYALLGTILSAQKAYYSEYGNFLRASEGCGWTSFDTIFGIDARGNKYFTCFLASNNVSLNPKEYFDAFVKKPTELINVGDYKELGITYNIGKSVEFVERNQ